jgi:hypothetical protein
VVEDLTYLPSIRYALDGGSTSGTGRLAWSIHYARGLGHDLADTVQHLLDGGYRDAISFISDSTSEKPGPAFNDLLQTATAFFCMSLKLKVNATEIGNETGVLLSP